MALHRASHSIYSIDYHIAWATKYRKYILTSLMCGWCKKYLTEAAREYDIYINAIEVLPDHVHLLVSAPPRWSISQIVRILKSKSARAMFQHFPNLRKHYYGGELWIDGYFVTTIGKKTNYETIKKYINQQRQGKLFR